MRLCLLFFCLGVTITASLAALPGICISATLVLLPLYARIIWPDMPVFLLACLIFLVGVGYVSWTGQLRLSTKLPPEYQNKTIAIQGTVTGLPRQQNKLWQFNLQSIKIDQQSIPGKLRLSWYSHKQLIPGQTWRLTVRLQKPKGIVSSGAFNVESWFLREQIIGSGYVIRSYKNQCITTNHWHIDYLRFFLGKRIQAAMPDKNTGLIQALLLGNKGAVSPEDWELLNYTGTTHLLVISGLHIGLIFMLGCFFTGILRRCRLLPLNYISFPRITVIAGLLLGGLYALLAGFSIPVQRALIMLFCGCLGQLFDFAPKPSTVWLVAMSIVLLIDPLAAVNIGFWYSFTAVAALLLVFSNRPGMQPGWKRWWLPQWAVFTALTPLLIWNQQPSSWLSPLINLVSVPLVGLIIVPLLMCGLLLILVPWSVASPLELGNWLLAQWKGGLQWVASHSEISMSQSISHPFVLFLILAGVVLLLLPRGAGWRWFSLPCLMLFWYSPVEPIAPGKVEIAVLDVKRRQVVVIRTQKHVLVYDMDDTSKKERFTNTRSVVLPYLRRHNIRHVDTWILPSSLEKSLSSQQFSDAMPVNTTYTFQNKKTDYHETGRTWRWDGVMFQLLPATKKNAILQIEAGKHRALLSTQLTPRETGQLLRQNKINLRSDLWILSLLNYTPEQTSPFLATVKPAHLALSLHNETRHRQKIHALKQSLLPLKSALAITSRTGTQTYTLGGETICSLFARGHHGHWWY